MVPAVQHFIRFDFVSPPIEVRFDFD